jgi:hypothetical protein
MCPRSLDFGRGLVARHPPHPLIAGGRLVGSRARPRRKALTPAPGAMALWHGKQGDWQADWHKADADLLGFSGLWRAVAQARIGRKR